MSHDSVQFMAARAFRQYRFYVSATEDDWLSFEGSMSPDWGIDLPGEIGRRSSLHCGQHVIDGVMVREASFVNTL